jgi:chromosome segregation ATPase
MYEKLGIEKQLLANDYETCKEHCAKLERQFLRLGNGPALQAQVDMLKAQVDSLNKELSDCYSTIKSRDFAIKEMHVEIDALNIAFEKHVLYEGTGRSRYNGVGRETLRDLYHELGRKQAEIHSMSAALSEAHENHDKLQKSYDTAIEILQTTRVDLEKFRDANKELQELTEKRNDEIEVLRGHNNELRDAIANLEGVVADLSSRLAETHERAETLASEVASKTGALHELQLESSHTIATLSEKIESMGVSLEHRDNTIKLFEQRAAREREAMERERADMRARVAESSKWEAQFDTYRRSSLNALQEKDSRIVKLEDELQSALTRNDELLGKEALFERVVSERDVMSESLQRSLDASKSLFDKLQAEIAHRESLEAKLEDTTAQLNAATEQIHNFESVKHQYAYAILDAYQQERDKNIQLERILLLQKGSTGTSSTPDSNESGIAQSPGRSEINTSVPAIPPAFGAGLGASPAVTPTRNAASGLRIDPLASSAVDATLTATNGLLAPSQASADDSVLEANQNMVAQTHSILQKLQR